jgi:hypothetical protein
MFHILKVFAAAAMVWSVILSGSCTAADSVSRPFVPGEKLTFDLKWGGIGAGKAVVQVLPPTTRDGVAAYHFVMTARTTKTIDRIFKIRDRLESYADLKMTHSLLYKQKIREGGYRKNRVITFDWEKNELTYVSNNSKPKHLSLMPGTFDPLAAFYFIRLQPLKTVKKVECPITDGKKNVMGRVNVVGRETIRLGKRTYATVVLEPILEDVELFNANESSGIRIWITADERQIPVLVESKVSFGLFRAELRKVEHLSPPAKQ